MHLLSRITASASAPLLRAPLLPALVALLAGLPAAAAAQMVFEPLIKTSLQNSSFSQALGDLDGDGDADLVLGNLSGAPLVRLSDGSGGFEPAVLVAQPVIGASVALADLDDDGILDLLAGTSASFTPALWVMRGQGDGSFGTPAAAPLGVTTYVNTLVIEAGDADGDGDLDVAATVPPVTTSIGLGITELRLLLNDGTGALTTALVAPSVAPAYLLQAFPTDVNGDALPDLVVATYRIVDFFSVPRGLVLTGTAGGGFVTTQALPDVTVEEVADLDGDGEDDLLTTIAGGGLVQIRPGNGSGTYPPGSLSATGFTVARVGFGDFDGDGARDLVAIGNSTSAVAHFLHGDGLAGFPGPIVPYSLLSFGVFPPLIADVDGDGRQDFAVIVDQISGSPKVAVARNRTYTTAEPLHDLGFALAGGKGFPIQVAAGQFGAGDSFSFVLHGAPAGGAAYHFVGASQIFAPFKGGVLVPAPSLITGPWIADAAGKVTLAGTWPGGVPAGATLTLQYWFPDAVGIAGLAASSAVAITF